MKQVKNYFLNSSYQLLLVILPLATAPYVSRVLGPQGVGLNSFTAAIVQYFVLFALLGTNSYGNREIAYHQDDKEKRSQIFWGITFLSWITATACIIAFFVFLSLIHVNREIYMWQGVAIVTAMFDVSWYFSGRENFAIITARNFIFKILSVICVFLFVQNSNDLIVYIAIYAIGALLGNLSLWPYLRKEIFRPRFSGLQLKKHFHGTILLFLPTVTIQIYVVINKNMIGILDSIDAVGFFYSSDNIIKICLSLVVSIGSVMLPHVANLHAHGDMLGVRRSIMQTFNIASGIACAIFFGLSAISLKFAPFFLGQKFEIVGTILMIEAPIIIFIAWSNVFGIQYLLPLNRMKIYTGSVTVGAISNVVINLILIPFLGVIGAVIATVIAEMLVMIYQYLHIRKDFSGLSLFSGVWKYFLAGIIMFIIVFTLSRYLTMNIKTLVIQIIVGILIYSGLNVALKTELWLRSSKLLRARRSH